MYNSYRKEKAEAANEWKNGENRGGKNTRNTSNNNDSRSFIAKKYARLCRDGRLRKG